MTHQESSLSNELACETGFSMLCSMQLVHTHCLMTRPIANAIYGAWNTRHCSPLKQRTCAEDKLASLAGVPCVLQRACCSPASRVRALQQQLFHIRLALPSQPHALDKHNLTRKQRMHPTTDANGQEHTHACTSLHGMCTVCTHVRACAHAPCTMHSPSTPVHLSSVQLFLCCMT